MLERNYQISIETNRGNFALKQGPPAGYRLALYDEYRRCQHGLSLSCVPGERLLGSTYIAAAVAADKGAKAA